jgi:hypothetical protein
LKERVLSALTTNEELRRNVGLYYVRNRLLDQFRRPNIYLEYQEALADEEKTRVKLHRLLGTSNKGLVLPGPIWDLRRNGDGQSSLYVNDKLSVELPPSSRIDDDCGIQIYHRPSLNYLMNLRSRLAAQLQTYEFVPGGTLKGVKISEEVYQCVVLSAPLKMASTQRIGSWTR